MQRGKGPSEKWRENDVQNNKWGQVNKKLKEAKKVNESHLRDPINMFQRRKDI